MPGTVEGAARAESSVGEDDGSTLGSVVLVDQAPAFGAGVAMAFARWAYATVAPENPARWLADHDTAAVLVTVYPESGTETLRGLRMGFPDAIFVAVLVSARTLDHVAALRAGAHATVDWRADPAEIAEVTVAALEGRTILPTAVAHALAVSAPAGVPPLPPEDVRWLRTLAGGCSAVELAAAEGYSQREVFRRLSALYRRIGARNRQEAIVMAARWGLVEGPDPQS